MLTGLGTINCAKDEGISNRTLLHFDVTLSEPVERRTVCPVQTPATRGTTRAVTTCSVITGTIQAVPHRLKVPTCP
jgi:hypothetical protein